MIFFFEITIKYIKNKNLVHLTLLNDGVQRCGRSHMKLVDKFHYLDDQYLVLDVPILKLTITIIILPTDRPDIILPTAVQQKINLPSPNIFFHWLKKRCHKS